MPPALLAEWPGISACYCNNTGWNGYRNKSQLRKLTMEKKTLPPLMQGLEPATFQSWVQCSNHWTYTRLPQSVDLCVLWGFAGCGCSQFNSDFLCAACDRHWELHETFFDTEDSRREKGLPVGEYAHTSKWSVFTTHCPGVRYKCKRWCTTFMSMEQ